MAVWSVDRRLPIDLLETTLSLFCFEFATLKLYQLRNFSERKHQKLDELRCELDICYYFPWKPKQMKDETTIILQQSFSKILEIVSIFCLLSFNILKEIETFLFFWVTCFMIQQRERNKTRAILLWMTFSVRLSHS